MALYEFCCQDPACQYHAAPFERLVPMTQRDAAMRCPLCGGPASRVVVPSSPASCVLMKPLNLGGHTKERLLP